MKYLLIAIVASLLFIPFLGTVSLFDPWETAFAEAAREMLASGHYAVVQLDFHPAYDKFPLFIWLQAGSMGLFGVNEFAARFPNAITGVITLLTLYAIGKKLVDTNLGIWWVLIYAGSWLPQIWFKSGLTDPVSNYFTFLGVYFAYRIGYTVKPARAAVLSGLCLGLAVLANGPAPIVAALLTLLVYWVYSKGKLGIRLPHLGIILLLACLPVALWLCYAGIVQGWGFVHNFFRYQAELLPEAWRRGAFYYWVLVPGSFPAIIFLLCYLLRRRRRSVYGSRLPLEMKEFNAWMWALCWIVLLVCPSSLYMLPLSFLAARQVYRIAEGQQPLPGWITGLLLFTGILLGLALTLLPLAGVYKDVVTSYINDPFIQANLQADIYWSPWETAYGLLYIIMVMVSGALLFRKQYQRGLVCLFMGSLILIQVSLLHFAPKIAAHTQGGAIRFYRSFEGKEVFILPLKFTTYAHLFYTKKPDAVILDADPEKLQNGVTRGVIYFICRNTDSGPYRHHPFLEVAGEQGGYVFFRKK